MFEFGRELRRFFGGGRGWLAGKDGLTGGEAPLLELLDLKLLKSEAKGADVAAGRISVRDKPRRLLEAAVVWRELARRTGDNEALDKASATAGRAADAFATARRQQGWARARLEQGACALAAIDLFGEDPGLSDAAERAAKEAQKAGGAAGLLAQAMMANVRARRALAAGGPTEARAAARGFNDCLAQLTAAGRRDGALKLAAAWTRMDRAELLLAAAVRLKDEGLARAAVGDLTAAAEPLEVSYHPLTLARLRVGRAAAQAALCELADDMDGLALAARDLTAALDWLGRDQSPLDWAKGQTTLAHTLSELGAASGSEEVIAKAMTRYERAYLAIGQAPALVARIEAALGRTRCLARQAELTGDLKGLNAVVTALKRELAAAPHGADPAAWAMVQVQLGLLYAARLTLTGRDRGERAAAALAFQAALEVFAEEGLRRLSAVAAQGLERLTAAKVSLPPLGRDRPRSGGGAR
jgi:hypothetical protein